MTASSFVAHRALGLAAAVALLGALATPAAAWPPELESSLYRDAQRLLPRSLAILLHDRERAVLEAAHESRPELTGWSTELTSGRISPETAGHFDAQLKDAAALMFKRQMSAGLIRMGALFRVAADVSDPVLCGGADRYPPGVVREYYSFIAGNLDKIPVVLDDPAALKLGREQLPGYWQGLLARSREDSPVILTELFINGRVVNHAAIDYRSPVFGVGSLAYSRAVNSVAATWLAGWRGVRGDLTQMRRPRIVEPRDSSPPQADANGGQTWPQRNP
jgi:hypothetical protein